MGLGLAAGASGLLAGCASVRDFASPKHIVMNFANEGPLPNTPPPATPGGEPSVIRTAVDLNLRMTAPVFLDDKGPFTFLVDTGANVSVLATDLAAELDLPPGPAVVVHGIAGIFSAPTVKVRRLSVGTVSTSELLTPVMNGDALGDEGLLGVDVLKNRLVRLDFRRRSLSIGPSHGSYEEPLEGIISVAKGGGSRLGPGESDESLVIVPARYRFGQLTVVDADVGGLPITAFLDSGSETTVGNSALLNGFGRKRPDLIRQSRTVQLLSATGQTAMAQIAPLPVLRLGGMKIGNLSAAFADLHAFEIWGLAARPSLLIGMDILRHFNMVELDFGGRQVRFHIGGELARTGADS